MAIKLSEYRLSKFSGRNVSKFIKFQLFKYFRYQRQYTFCCSEAINHADISALDSKNLVEVEIKISKQDFLKEFDGKSKVKTYKHKVLQGKYKPRNRYIVPNYYYFCVTDEIKDFVLEYLRDKGLNKYGVLVCKESRIYGTETHIECVKKPKRIHTNKPSNNTFIKVGRRVQSELNISIEKEIERIMATNE